MLTDNVINIDILWILLCGCLVALMQAGFTCLESGLVRAKNSINVAIKNLVDFCISITIFALFGFGIMFGASHLGLFGTSHFLLTDRISTSLMAFFFFQAMFCGTSITIVSGAVAERMRFNGYCIASIILAGLIYPVVGHWAWNGAETGTFTGWLGAIGFIDFAGSTIVHSVGGWMALAAIIVIGPRIGRFGSQGRRIEGNSLPMSTLGVFLLWFGWFGFNGGSTLEINKLIPLILVNTALAGAGGGLTSMVFTWIFHGRPQVGPIINGVIAGLVSITASPHIIPLPFAILIGGIGGIVCISGMIVLERFEIDDAIGAVPAHLFAGVWGTLAVALFAPDGSWGTGLTRWDQLTVQLLGIVVIGIFSFTVSFILLKIVNYFVPLRVGVDDERIGLNITEHGASTSNLDLIIQMDRQAHTGDYSKPVNVEPETEAAQIAMFYNTVLDGFNTEQERSHMALKKLTHFANYDTLTGLANRRFYFDAVKRALARAKRTGKSGALLYLDLDGFKEINDKFGHEMGDLMLKDVGNRLLTCLRETDILARIGGDEFSLLLESIENKDSVISVAEKIIDSISDPFELNDHRLYIGISIGITLFPFDKSDTVSSIIRKADHAMYSVKLEGKGSYQFFKEII